MRRRGSMGGIEARGEPWRGLGGPLGANGRHIGILKDRPIPRGHLFGIFTVFDGADAAITHDEVGGEVGMAYSHIASGIRTRHPHHPRPGATVVHGVVRWSSIVVDAARDRKTAIGGKGFAKPSGLRTQDVGLELD